MTISLSEIIQGFLLLIETGQFLLLLGGLCLALLLVYKYVYKKEREEEEPPMFMAENSEHPEESMIRISKENYPRLVQHVMHQMEQQRMEAKAKAEYKKKEELGKRSKESPPSGQYL